MFHARGEEGRFERAGAPVSTRLFCVIEHRRKVSRLGHRCVKFEGPLFIRIIIIPLIVVFIMLIMEIANFDAAADLRGELAVRPRREGTALEVGRVHARVGV